MSFVRRKICKLESFLNLDFTVSLYFLEFVLQYAKRRFILVCRKMWNFFIEKDDIMLFSQNCGDVYTIQCIHTKYHYILEIIHFY